MYVLGQWLQDELLACVCLADWCAWLFAYIPYIHFGAARLRGVPSTAAVLLQSRKGISVVYLFHRSTLVA